MKSHTTMMNNPTVPYVSGPPPARAADAAPPAHTRRKRIGSTVYIVNIHYNLDAKETMSDKLLRLISDELSSD